MLCPEGMEYIVEYMWLTEQVCINSDFELFAIEIHEVKYDWKQF